MISKPAVLGLVAAACVTAAAGGAFVAVRQNVADQQAASVAPATPDSAATPVSETEAVVAPPAAAPEPPAPAPAVSDKADPTVSPAPERETPRSTKRAASAATSTARRGTPPWRPERQASPAPAASTPAANGTGGPAPAREMPPTPATPASVDPAPASEPARYPEPVPPVPERQFVELIVPSSSVIGLQMESTISSERARVEDRVEARVTRDVMSTGRVAIPAGSRVLGSVTLVERGGKMKERARLGIRFHTLVLADGTEVPLRTEAIMREGESPGGEASKKIGGAAVGGAILGAILGGGKGAVVGGATGAAGGTAIVMAGDRNAATIASGSTVTIRLSSPVTIEVEKEQ